MLATDLTQWSGPVLETAAADSVLIRRNIAD